MKKLLLISSVSICVLTSIIAATKPHSDLKLTDVKREAVLTGTDNSPK